MLGPGCVSKREGKEAFYIILVSLLLQPPVLGTGRVSKRGGKAARQMAAAGGVALPTGMFVTFPHALYLSLFSTHMKNVSLCNDQC